MGINYSCMNNRPSWEKAPEWAMYSAMDKGCVWYWYENEPKLNVKSWLWLPSNGKFAPVQYLSNNLETDAHWTETLEKRKEVEPDEA